MTLVIPSLYKHLKSYEQIKKSKKILKPSYFLGIALFTFIIIGFLCLTIMCLSHCQNPDLFFIFLTLTDVAWKLQLILVSQILFYKLWIVFRLTIFKISKCTIKIWIVYHIIVYTLYFIGFSLYYFTPIYHGLIAYIMPIATTFAVFGQIWLNFTFVRKLNRCHKTDTDLVNIATKSSILCFICTSSTFLLCILTPFLFAKIELDVVFWIVVMFDQYTNYWCIILSYKHFNKLYTKLCGSCHNCCDWVWLKCYEDMESVIAMQTSTNKVESTENTAKIEISNQSACTSTTPDNKNKT